MSSEVRSQPVQLRWGVPDPLGPRAPAHPEARRVSVYKLEHDIEQLTYLRQLGRLGPDFDAPIEALRRALGRLRDAGITGRVPLDDTDEAEIGAIFNRLVYLRPSPRMDRPLSESWNAAEVEARYVDEPPGLVVIDDFLSPEALREVRDFCLESTVWGGNRYGHGRLGAFFRDGFNSPLLLQIAADLRNRLPRIIGERHPLRQLWGFKNRHHLPGNSTTHADFAAVNVNFWLTPEDANLDPHTGGLVVYPVEAPADWEFETYNRRPDRIQAFLRAQQAAPVVVPYRSNRAILFNSDLFHGTQEVNFREGYTNRRVNVTMLFGDRARDVHHRTLGRPVPPAGPPHAWRSAAFRRPR